jgi:hypothetical protein
MDICNLQGLNRLRLVCKIFNNCININPKLFWFKHPIKFHRKIYPCRGCVFEREILPNFLIITIFHWSSGFNGLEIFPERIKRLR